MGAMLTAKRKVAAMVAAGMLAAGAGLVLARAMEAVAAEAEVGPPEQAGTSGLGTLRIESTPSGAKVFIRTGGHNGYAEVGRTPITLRDIEPGLLEYTLLRPGCQLYDGSLWVEPGREHVERVRMKPGRVFFVDQENPRASDANAGTEEAPWKTIKHACEVLVAGDTVLVKKGKYYQNAGWRTATHKGGWPPYAGIRPQNSGEAGRPITLRAYPGHDVYVMSGPSLKSNPLPTKEVAQWNAAHNFAKCRGRFGDFTNPAIGSHRKEWVVIDGFKVYGGVWFTEGSHCLVQNCEIWQGWGHNAPDVGDNNDCIWLGASFSIARNNLLRDNRYNSTKNSTGLKIYGQHNCIVENNEVYNTFLGLWHKSRGGERHIFRRNFIHDCNDAFSGPIGSKQAPHDSFYQNILCDCSRTTFAIISQSVNHQIFNNTFHQRTANNNGILVRKPTNKGTRLYNNILSGRFRRAVLAEHRESLSVMDLWDMNCYAVPAGDRFAIGWKRVGDGTLNAWRAATGLDAHSIEANPSFVDADARDFRLKPGSPCIDAGRPVTYAVGEGEDTDTITVEYAYSFTDGLGLIDGDVIQIGKGEEAQFARVLKVIDRTHLKLDKKVSWSDGDWVTFPFKGEAPDIGAYEFGDERQVIGPTWKHYPKRDFPKKSKR